MSKTSLKLPGAVCKQMVKCGKPRCKCTRGERHGPYFYRFWRENGKLQKRYVRLADVQRVRGACDTYRQQQRRERAEYREAMQLLRRFRAELRGMPL